MLEISHGLMLICHLRTLFLLLSFPWVSSVPFASPAARRGVGVRGRFSARPALVYSSSQMGLIFASLRGNSRVSGVHMGYCGRTVGG